MGRLELVRQDEKVTVLKGLLTPFGNPDKLDLAGEFFDENTWFGDEYGITVKFAVYDHAINDMQNPYSEEGAPPDPILGVCKFIEKDARGRWFEFEIQRANEYHDYVMALHAMNRLGASSRTLPGRGVKEMDPQVKGRIAKWPEVEGTLCPTPCNDETAWTEEEVGAVVGAMKTFAPNLYNAAVLKAMQADAAKKNDAEAKGGEAEKPVPVVADTVVLDPVADALEKLKAPVEETLPEVKDDSGFILLQEKVAALEARLVAAELEAAEVKSLKAVVTTLQQHLTGVIGEATTLKKNLADLKTATRSSIMKGLSAQELAALGLPKQDKPYVPPAGDGKGTRPVLKSAFANNPDAPGS